MHPTAAILLEVTLLIGAWLLALPFKPWLALRYRPLQAPWGAALLALPALWWTGHLLPGGMALYISGACMLVLMFGWPLAMWMLLPVGMLASAMANGGWPLMPEVIRQVVWLGVVPGTLALLLGLLVRQWLPRHLFVYILGRGFIVTALAGMLAATLALLVRGRPEVHALQEWLIAHWLLSWGEGVATGMLTSIFVAFRPEWLLTYSDTRYMPGAAGR